MVRIVCISYRDKMPTNGQIVNVTSRSTTWSKQLSPFFLGPVKLYGEYTARSVENGWQFSKVYDIDGNGEPSETYWNWAKQGWNDNYAHRYPAGKGAKPYYTYWDGAKLSYVQARRQVYIPLYSRAVIQTSAYQKLKELYENIGLLYLLDFDAYDYTDLTYDQVIEDENKKMGHCFVLAMLLEGYYKGKD